MAKVHFSKESQYFEVPEFLESWNRMADDLLSLGKEAAINEHSHDPIMMLYIDFIFKN